MTREISISLGAPSRTLHPLKRADASSSQAIVLAELGHFSRALGTAERIRDPDMRQSTFQAIARTQRNQRPGQMAYGDLRRAD